MLTRPATRADLSAIVDLFCRYEAATRGAPDTDDSDVTGDWDAEGFDLERGTLVLEEDGRLVGYAVVSGEAADTVVEPDEPREERFERLLAWVETSPGPLQHYVADAEPAMNALMERRGWQPARRFWRMRRELDGPLPEPGWPAGVTVHAYDRPADDEAVHALIQTAFREIGGQHERTLEQWRGFLLQPGRFDPELYLVARAGDEVVGAALGQHLDDVGFVRQLAVASSQRGRGLGLALLHECFARHAARGFTATVLGVDAGNPTGALKLYEKAGMRVVEQFTRWERG